MYMQQKGDRFGRYPAARRFLCLTLALVLASGVLWTKTSARGNDLATPRSCLVSVNGKETWIQAYDVQGVSYYKLRDIAALLQQTVKTFQLTWNEEPRSIHVELDHTYTPAGGELHVSEAAAAAIPTQAPIFQDGNEMSLFSYCIQGNTYLTLENLADLLQLEVRQEGNGSPLVIENAPVEEADGENAYALTLRAGDSDALLNGEAVSLSAPPFVRNESFYLPLEPVAELLGGRCLLQGSQVTLELMGHTSVYTLYNGNFTVDGEAFRLPEVRTAFSPSRDHLTVAETFGPVLEQGKVFLPLTFLETCDAGLRLDWIDPEHAMVILSSFQHELGVKEAKLLYRYEHLSPEFRNSLTDLGLVGQVGDLPYDEQKYANDGVALYVMRLRPGFQDLEHMDGKIAAIHVTGRGPSTPRGLRVGDDVQRAKLLYGDVQRSFSMTDSFQCQVTDDQVSAIVFGTRFSRGEP